MVRYLSYLFLGTEIPQTLEYLYSLSVVHRDSCAVGDTTCAKCVIKYLGSVL